MKRNAPADFDKSERPDKMLRSDLISTTLRALGKMAPTPAPAIAPSSRDVALKRKRNSLDTSENFAAPKKACLVVTTTSLKGCRGGTTRATRKERVVVDDNSDDANEDATSNGASSPSAGKGTAEVLSSIEGDAAVTTSEDVTNAEEENEDAATDNTSSPSPGKDTAEVSTASEEDEAVTATEPAVEAENDSNNSCEPVSSSRKSVSGSIKTADGSSSRSSSEPASSSQKPDNGSSETLDTVVTVSEPEEAPKKTTKVVEKKQRHINGLLNNGNQCFANATLQFLDAAFDGHDLDLLLGHDVSIDPFMIPNLVVNDTEGNDAPKKGEKPAAKPKSRFSRIKASIRDRIEKSRSGGKLKDISPRRHLRALLNRMRGSRSSGQPNWLTPLVFQQILAHGDEDAGRGHLDGTTQEDCYEYFDAVMSGVASTTAQEAESAVTLKSVFEIKSDTATECSNSSCDHKDTAQADASTAISLSVWKSKKRPDLMDLLDASNTSALVGVKCPKCGEEKLARVTELKDVSDNLVLHINRVSNSGNGNKLQTPVELPLKPITVCGKEFVLNAVVRHKGYTVNGGHYTILRRRSPEWVTDDKSLWYLINDEEITAITAENVKDHGKYGHSAMLLFKAL